ncbi:LysE family transporter [Rhizobium sp. CG5]|uniref:LysE family translocator n=1 Tax=Rhizobium sp. CG5 TaxID=2726076 RepID=UPI0020347872|nr:LysE family transporter [Rhizobium sp. CG5]MCM2473669.1 LysE family transporter [Rhizobium sp. CG5]
MSSSIVILGILTAILIGAMSPGPSFVLVSHTALGRSRAAGLAAALGMGAGGAIFAALALAGLGALLARVEWLHLILKLLGGLYLLYLASRLWRGAADPLPVDMPEQGREPSLLRSFLLGLTTQLGNPKTAVVYASIFVAFLPADPDLSVLAILPPAVFVVEAGWYALVALVFSASLARTVYGKAKAWIDRAAALVMAGLGARLILESVRVRLA